MPWGVYDREAEVRTSPDLDRFRRAVATTLDHGRPAGHVFTVVSVGWNLSGWDWWRPRWGRPFEYVDIFVAPDPPHRRDVIGREVRQIGWDGTSLRFDGRMLELRWLDGTEAEQALRRFHR